MNRSTRSGGVRPAPVRPAPVKQTTPPASTMTTRKRIKPPTPPVSRRETRTSRSNSSEGSSSQEPPRVLPKVTHVVSDLYKANLDALDYYQVLNVGRGATKAEIKSAANSISRSKKRDTTAEKENTPEQIHKVLNDAVFVLSSMINRNAYNRVLDEKIKMRDYYKERVRPLLKTLTEIYNGALRARNDLDELYEMDVLKLLQEHVYATIERNTKNKHYKSTKSNRIRVQWTVTDIDLGRNIDERYLANYFKNDGLIGLVMCSTRPGCAVLEVLTSHGVTSIIDRENKRGVFEVRDYTEAEFGADNTDFSRQIDQLNTLTYNLDEFEKDIMQRASETVPFEVNASAVQDQLDLLEDMIKMEEDEEEEEEYDDDEDEEMLEYEKEVD
ncbi:J domain protein [Peridroma alphabaculovirus]|uniref:J domain protein n=1 Tax=Peridroma alphabaculovirus TaxID=1346829 RepID=A0A068LMJ9_9ABAC|nr:J domain protein [Peridroma alphabaculovirus]AIE47771.1 J domain protein [Peridroma alphabaculovirus]